MIVPVNEGSNTMVLLVSPVVVALTTALRRSTAVKVPFPRSVSEVAAASPRPSTSMVAGTTRSSSMSTNRRERGRRDSTGREDEGRTVGDQRRSQRRNQMWNMGDPFTS
ncbi:MAG: hypothetical protein U0792_12435 [Gemmataceae bacterium]